MNLEEVLNIQIDTVQETSLSKYVHVFTTIGVVLLIISLLIILTNKPLEKLMHGVK